MFIIGVLKNLFFIAIVIAIIIYGFFAFRTKKDCQSSLIKTHQIYTFSEVRCTSQSKNMDSGAKTFKYSTYIEVENTTTNKKVNLQELFTQQVNNGTLPQGHFSSWQYSDSINFAIESVLEEKVLFKVTSSNGAFVGLPAYTFEYQLRPQLEGIFKYIEG